MSIQLDRNRPLGRSVARHRASAPSTRLLLGDLLLLVTISLLVRVTDLHRPPIFDELYHVLAARSWLADGTFGIGDGLYDRAGGYTILIAFFMHTFGDSLAAARLPSIIAGTLGVVTLFLWVRHEADRRSAWIAALILSLTPIALLASLHIRFYALHNLLFLLGSIGVYVMATRPLSWRVRLGLVAGVAALWAGALHLQITTAMGILAVGSWLVFWLGFTHGKRLLCDVRVAAVIVTAALTAGLLVVLVWGDQAAFLMERYRTSMLWNAEHQHRFDYYIMQLGDRYPTLLTLFPVAAIVAIGLRPALGSFCAVMFSVLFVLLSFGGAKAERYMLYAMPFFFAVWGIALAGLAGRLGAFLRGRADMAVVRLSRGEIGVATGRVMTAMVVAVTLVFIVITNPGFPTALKIIVAPERSPAEDWAAAVADLDLAVDEADIVLTTEDLYGFYYFDRHDMFISATKLSETSRQPAEFDLDPRSGRPVISEPDSMARVLACYPNGIIIAEERHWLNELYVREDVALLIRNHARRVPLATAPGLRVYRWDVPMPDSDVDCADLMRFR